MSGAPEQGYVLARKALLDATDALVAHLDSITLVGAQAVYVHTADADRVEPEYALADEYTSDADFCVDPRALADTPLIGDVLTASGFTAGVHPGAWVSPDGVAVDLMVPESIAGPGRRGARLGVHGKRAARRAAGLEGALVDHDRCTLDSLDPTDDRSVIVRVAGPGALLVAKLHKIANRLTQNRPLDKDALDVVRLLRSTPRADMAAYVARLKAHEITATPAAAALADLRRLFGTLAAPGVAMATRAAGPNVDPATFGASITALTSQLLEDLSPGAPPKDPGIGPL